MRIVVWPSSACSLQVQLLRVELSVFTSLGLSASCFCLYVCFCWVTGSGVASSAMAVLEHRGVFVLRLAEVSFPNTPIQSPSPLTSRTS